MQFRRSGQRAERRRRVLIDETVTAPMASQQATAGAGAESAAPDPAELRNYAEAALAIHQPRVTDLIPTRRWTLAVLLLTALTIISGLEALYGRLSGARGLRGLSGWEALDPSQSASLAGWFSSVLLGAASLGGVLIYSLRRHKIDDYRGRYRLWLWIAALLTLGSIDAVTGLHQAAIDLALQFAKWPVSASAAAFWDALYAVALGAVGIRLAIEMRQCRTATCTLAAAAASYLLAAGLGPERMPGNDPLLATMAVTTATMLGHLGLSFSIGLYARYVDLDAQGALPVRRRVSGQAGQSVRDTEGDKNEEVRDSGVGARSRRSVRTDLGPPSEPVDKKRRGGETRSVRGRSGNQAAGVGDRRLDDTHEPGRQEDAKKEEEAEAPPLSRAERRRLRKRQRRECSVQKQQE